MINKCLNRLQLVSQSVAQTCQLWPVLQGGQAGSSGGSRGIAQSHDKTVAVGEAEADEHGLCRREG